MSAFNSWYKDKLATDHWEEDRSDYLLERFVDDDLAVSAMEKWLRLDKVYDGDRLVELFNDLSKEKQKEIAEEYIEDNDDARTQFNNWYNERYYGDDIDLEAEYEYEVEHGWRD